MTAPMVCVPVEPTEAMIEAACISGCDDGERGWYDLTSGGVKTILRTLNRKAYKAMLAAAPAPPQAVQGEAVQIAAPGDVERKAWSWLAPLGALVGAAKSRDLSAADHEAAIDAAHAELFAALRSQGQAVAVDDAMVQRAMCAMFGYQGAATWPSNIQRDMRAALTAALAQQANKDAP